jgi:hypothetical protein
MTPSRWGVLIAGAVYLAYALFLTWPLPTEANGSLSGPNVSADLAGGTAEFAYMIHHGIFPFASGTMTGLNAPQGLAVPWVLNLASAPDRGLIYGLSLLLGATLGANVFLWLSFVLSGLSMFLLTRRLFGSQLAAGLAGFAFAFYPFAVNQIGGHIEYMDGWVLMLGVWRMIELAHAPTRRNALLAGCAVAFSMWFTPYFILIGGVAYAVLAVVTIVMAHARGMGRVAVKAVGLSAVPIIALLAAIGALTVLAGQTGAIRTQDLQQLVVFSARVPEWLLPDRNNFLFGGLTRPYLSSHLHGSNFGESSLYLGVSVIVLALAGALLAARRIRSERGQAAADIRVTAAVAASCLAAVAAALSLPPITKVFGLKLAMPSGFLFALSSTWRVYSRFVELIELGLCILLAYAVAALLRRFGSGRRLAIFAVLGVILIVDLWARPPAPRATTMSLPSEYVWLAHHPGGIVADYPLQAADYPYYRPLVYAEEDGHPSFQGYSVGSETESMKLGLASLREPTTASELAALHVRYIVVHPGQPGGDAANLRRQGYILSSSAPDGQVWQDAAHPARARVDGLDGLSPIVGPAGQEYRWVLYPVDPGAQTIYGVTVQNCASCRVTMTFKSASNGQPRALTVREQGSDRVLARHEIPAGRPVTVRVRGITLAGGQARLVLSTDIPATASKSNDYFGWRSIYVEEPRLSIGSASR